MEHLSTSNTQQNYNFNFKTDYNDGDNFLKKLNGSLIDLEIKVDNFTIQQMIKYIELWVRFANLNFETIKFYYVLMPNDIFYTLRLLILYSDSYYSLFKRLNISIEDNNYINFAVYLEITKNEFDILANSLVDFFSVNPKLVSELKREFGENIIIPKFKSIKFRLNGAEIFEVDKSYNYYLKNYNHEISVLFDRDFILTYIDDLIDENKDKLIFQIHEINSICLEIELKINDFKLDEEIMDNFKNIYLSSNFTIQDDLFFNLLEINYKLFLSLICLKKEFRKRSKFVNLPFLDFLCPSETIDQLWHYHQLNNKFYNKDCIKLFGFILYHYPSSESNDEKKMYYNYYENFHKSVKNFFLFEDENLKNLIFHKSIWNIPENRFDINFIYCS